MASSNNNNDDADHSYTNFRRMSEDHHEQHEPVDDFFGTSTSGGRLNSNMSTNNNSHQYHPSSERFVFDGDEDDAAFISAHTPTSPYENDNMEPLLLGGYHRHHHSNSNNNFNNNNEDDEDHLRRLRLPFARLARHREQPRPDLSGLNILNIATFIAVLVVSILWESGLVETAMKNHHHHWLPSPWSITNTEQYETLLTPALWAGDFLWIPVMAFECLFSLVQLLPAVRTRSEVGEGVGYLWFHIGILHILATIFFCLRWVIPAWFALAINAICLLLLQFQMQRVNPLNKITEWQYWVFRFPFDLHLGWLLPLLASRGSMIFRWYAVHDIGSQLAADIVCMALLLPCAGACLTRGQGPADWVIPVLILWAYLGIACRLLDLPVALVEAYGIDIVVAVRDAAWCFAAAVGSMVIPNTVVWVAREFLTIQVVRLSDEEEEDSEMDGLVINSPRERARLESMDEEYF